MVVVAVIGLDLTLIRSWTDPPFSLDTLLHPAPRPAGVFGEFVSVMVLTLAGLAVAIASSGRKRRFGVVVVLAGLAISGAFFLAPSTFRHMVLESIIVPIQLRRLPRPLSPAWGCTENELRSLCVDVGVEHYRYGLTRCPFGCYDSQLVLGLVQSSLVLAIGVVSALLKRGSRDLTSKRPSSLGTG